MKKKNKLLDWKRRKGYTYADLKRLLEDQWSETWVKMIFLGTAKPGRDLLLSLSNLTGLSALEIAGEK